MNDFKFKDSDLVDCHNNPKEIKNYLRFDPITGIDELLNERDTYKFWYENLYDYLQKEVGIDWNDVCDISNGHYERRVK